MGIVLEIVLFIATFAFTILWFSNIFFPLLYSFPVAIYWSARGLVRWRAPFGWLIAPALWLIVPLALSFAAAQVFSSAALLRFGQRPGVVFGQLAGLLLMILGLFRRDTWRDLRSEFWKFELRFFDWPKISDQPRLTQVVLDRCSPNLGPNDLPKLLEHLSRSENNPPKSATMQQSEELDDVVPRFVLDWYLDHLALALQEHDHSGIKHVLLRAKREGLDPKKLYRLGAASQPENADPPPTEEEIFPLEDSPKPQPTLGQDDM